MLPNMRRLPKGTSGQGVPGRLICMPKNVGGMGSPAVADLEFVEANKQIVSMTNAITKRCGFSIKFPALYILALQRMLFESKKRAAFAENAAPVNFETKVYLALKSRERKRSRFPLLLRRG